MLSAFSAAVVCYDPHGTLEALRATLYHGADPFSSAANFSPEYRKTFSHLSHRDVTHSLKVTNATLWVEVGSFLGRSAITTADVIKRRHGKQKTEIVCIDPWTGATQQWMFHSMPALRPDNYSDFDFLQMDASGVPRLYEKFLANIAGVGHQDVILPIRASSLVGMNLLCELHAKGLLQRPQVIYLDSAHEIGETFLELSAAWRLLAPGGVLMGDDYSWPAVKHDLSKFVGEMGITAGLPAVSGLEMSPRSTTPVVGITLIDGTWYVYKARGQA